LPRVFFAGGKHKIKPIRQIIDKCTTKDFFSFLLIMK
jgi:hypothetical protein